MRCIKPLGRHRLIYAMTSVHKLVFTLILAITVYSFLQALFLLLVILIQIEYQIAVVLITIAIVVFNYIKSVVRDLKKGEDVVCDIIDND